MGVSSLICPHCQAGELVRIEKHRRQCNHCQARFWRKRRQPPPTVPAPGWAIHERSPAGMQSNVIEAGAETTRPSPVPFWVEIPIYLMLLGLLYLLSYLSHPAARP